jgi:uncharacterized RDD family membrane protein YckC
MEPVQQPEETNLLADDAALLYQYEEASIGKRLLNYIIDVVFCNYGLTFATGYLGGMVLNAVNPELLYEIVYEEGAPYWIYIYVITISTWFLYYTICEKAFNGQTLGKLLTGTRAIRDDGQSLTFRDAALRSLSRAVPFEAFSALGGRPWHDSWTNTRVVNKR